MWQSAGTHVDFPVVTTEILFQCLKLWVFRKILHIAEGFHAFITSIVVLYCWSFIKPNCERQFLTSIMVTWFFSVEQCVLLMEDSEELCKLTPCVWDTFAGSLGWTKWNGVTTKAFPETLSSIQCFITHGHNPFCVFVLGFIFPLNQVTTTVIFQSWEKVEDILWIYISYWQGFYSYSSRPAGPFLKNQ